MTAFLCDLLLVGSGVLPAATAVGLVRHTRPSPTVRRWECRWFEVERFGPPRPFWMRANDFVLVWSTVVLVVCVVLLARGDGK